MVLSDEQAPEPAYIEFRCLDCPVKVGGNTDLDRIRRDAEGHTTWHPGHIMELVVPE